ncbi:MAG: NADH-quinone oxidoreductase subunit NuoH [Chloroflexi bacterium]|nr:NADH-quinone oxidoreductase subunit NuoH [Chloroflexota bacterium]
MNSFAPLPPDWPGGYWLHWGVFVIIILAFVLLTVMIFLWYERRGLGRIQARLGPNRAGPLGLFQSVADAVKILTKEDIVPAKGDKIVFWLAPAVAFVPVLLVFAVIPFQDGAMLADLNVGILYVVAVSSISVIGIFMAGWGSNNKYSLIGAMRTVAQVVSYEIPLGLAIIGVVLISGSLSLTEIVAAQNIPFILFQPLGFLIFLMASLAEINRAPFDVMEADSEIVAGFHTEYSGMKYGMFYLAEYAEALVVSAIIATLFLGGWRGGVLPPVLWFLIKVFGVFFLIFWIRSTVPRVRIDQIMGFAWKFLLPLALINMFITGIEVVLLPDGLPWPIIFLNIAIAVILVVVWSRFFKLGGGRVEA